MKYIKIYTLFILGLVLFSCGDDDSVINITAPTPMNISADVRVTQDNSGDVSITPLGEGVAYYAVNFGDGSEVANPVQPGESVTHTYPEGMYTVTITAYSLDGSATTVEQTVNISFNPPSELNVMIHNDEVVSKQVNVTVNAIDAVSYTVDFGDDSGADPLEANIGESVSYQYAEPGTYTITVVVMGAAIETTTYTEEFVVTAIEQPVASATTPPARNTDDVISIFSAAYNDLADTDYFPDWDQGSQGSSWSLFDLNGDEMLQYTNISYQGNAFAAPVDLSALEYVHMDVWTADVVESIELSLISASNGERPVTTSLTPNDWTSIDIPISAFTDQDGFTVTDIHQLKYVGAPWAEGTVFIDNVYFWKEPTELPDISGTWKISPTAGSLRVGPGPGAGDWWSIDDAGVAQRACFYDDEYIFGADGSFSNVLGADTWVEGWQSGTGDACAAPVAPHDGSATASYTFNGTNITLNGTGAYLGIPKANNQGELPNVAVPDEITYIVDNVTDTNMTLFIETGTGSGTWWSFDLVKAESMGEPSPFEGSWSISPVAGSLRVGPAEGSGDWWAIDDAGVTQRACFYDDEYVFGANGSFSNVLGADTWVEGWQSGVGDACAAPVAPHDGSASASFAYDENNNTVTITGMGAYLGIPKANNDGELPNVAVPSAITYNVTFDDADTITLSIETGTGSGTWWTFVMSRN